MVTETWHLEIQCTKCPWVFEKKPFLFWKLKHRVKTKFKTISFPVTALRAGPWLKLRGLQEAGPTYSSFNYRSINHDTKCMQASTYTNVCCISCWVCFNLGILICWCVAACYQPKQTNKWNLSALLRGAFHSYFLSICFSSLLHWFKPARQNPKNPELYDREMSWSVKCCPEVTQQGWNLCWKQTLCSETTPA